MALDFYIPYISSIQKQPPEVFYMKVVLNNFVKLRGKHLSQSFLFNKVAGLRTATLLKETLAQVLLFEFCQILKNTFL